MTSTPEKRFENYKKALEGLRHSYLIECKDCGQSFMRKIRIRCPFCKSNNTVKTNQQPLLAPASDELPF